MARPYYGSEGQKSIDPTVFFRLMLIGYLENIISDRQLIEHVSMRMDLLYFIDYDIDDSLPWHSTISRTRKLLPNAIFEEAFERVLQKCVDRAHHVITHIRANHADRKDSLNLIDIARQTRKRLKRRDLKMDTLLADTGFSNGENYKYLEENGITGYIPTHGQYEGTREGFEYEPEEDRWRCSQGKYATFRKIKYQKNHPDKLYYTRRSDCKGCPLARGCIGKSHEKRISITVYKDYYDRALVRAKSRKGQYYKTIRQSTVEPVFGTLINFTGMRKINTRGIESANKVMLMAAIAYNLKKLLKYQGRGGRIPAQNTIPGKIASQISRLIKEIEKDIDELFQKWISIMSFRFNF